MTLDGIPREIDDPSKVSKAPVTRADWNWKAAQIKLAIKEFLKQEMQWKQTPQNPSEQKLDTVVLLKQDAKWGNQQSKTEQRKVPKEKDVEKKPADKKPNDKKPAEKKPEDKKDAQKKLDEKKEFKSQAK